MPGLDHGRAGAHRLAAAGIVRGNAFESAMTPRRLLLSCLLWLAANGSAAAPALAPAVRAELDAALQAYAAGQLAPARSAFESLAQRQVPAAQYNLAVMHLRGEVPRSDLVLAGELLTRAAHGGLVTAQLALAQALENADLGHRDLALAHRWYQVAAVNGSVDAQLAVGTAHFLGRGLAKDPALAVHWFREAAKGGDIGAMYLLASMYEQGDGVDRDLRLARYWYDQAARNGDEAAPAKVQELDARLASPPA